MTEEKYPDRRIPRRIPRQRRKGARRCLFSTCKKGFCLILRVRKMRKRLVIVENVRRSPFNDRWLKLSWSQDRLYVIRRNFSQFTAVSQLLPETFIILTMKSEKLYEFLLFSHSVLSDSLWPHRLQHTRLPNPSPSPRACSNSFPLSQWCHPTISSRVVPLSCLRSFPASGCFKWVSSSHQVAKLSELQLQHQSFQWIYRIDFL